MRDGIGSVSDAFHAAQAEVAEATATATEAPQPGANVQASVAVEQATLDTNDQPVAADATDGDDFQSELDALLLQEVSSPEADASGIELGSDEFWTLDVPLPDGEAVKMQELRDGYLRQSDYTRKTQELAAQRSAVEQATKAWESLNEDPAKFYAALGQRLGLSDGEPIAVNGLPTFVSADALEQEVQNRLDARVNEDPRVRQAALATAQAAVNATFGQIEQEFSVQLKPEVRTALMQRAANANTGDLRLVYMAAMAEAQSKRSASPPSSRIAAAATPDGNGRASAVAPADKTVAPPKTIAEAFAIARRERELANL